MAEFKTPKAPEDGDKVDGLASEDSPLRQSPETIDETSDQAKGGTARVAVGDGYPVPAKK